MALDYRENLELSRFVFESHLKALLQIYRDMEHVGNLKVKEIENEIEKWAEENSVTIQSVWDDSHDEMMDNYNHYKSHMHYTLMNSLFLSAFSLFENHLTRIVEIITDQRHPTIRITDINGNGDIDRLRKFLHLVIGVPSANGDFKEWQEIQHYKALRNAIVHNGSALNKAQVKDFTKMKGYPLLAKYKVWHSSTTVHFRIKQFEFLEDFTKLATGYSLTIITYLIE